MRPALRLMSYVAFLLERSEDGEDGRVSQPVREARLNLRDGP